jgi:hypothetical protein
MRRMGRTIIPHDAIEMIIMKSVIQDLGHHDRGVGYPINIEESHEPTLDPFLNRRSPKTLRKYLMYFPASQPAMISASF